ncbi:MAG: ABC transporter ATP-binding protein [Polyangiaceae bacterium]
MSSPTTFEPLNVADFPETCVVRGRGVSKRFPADRKDSLVGKVRRFLEGVKVPEPRWALHGVDFDVHRGEVVGIVGENGCGKTTLLSIVAGATYPTSGEVAVAGRISALLSLGMGFEGDMTTREAIEINAVVMGLTAEAARNAVPTILEFAEMTGRELTLIRHLSSGMRARLAFAVGVLVEPDILLVDEILAVGDESFQEKCRARIRAMSGEGVGVVFVSHDMALVRSMCTRVVWIDAGKIVRAGDAETVVTEYVAEAGRRTALRASQGPRRPSLRP